MTEIDDLRYTAGMSALVAERAYLELELAEMEPRRQALQARIKEIDEAISTGSVIESEVRPPGRWDVHRTDTDEPGGRSIPGVPLRVPTAPGGVSSGPPPSARPPRPRVAPSSPPRSVTPQAEQQVVAGMPVVDPSAFGMGVGPNGERPSGAVMVDPEDAAFVARMQQMAGADDWENDPRFNPGPTHTDPYLREMGE